PKCCAASSRAGLDCGECCASGLTVIPEAAAGGYPGPMKHRRWKFSRFVSHGSRLSLRSAGMTAAFVVPADQTLMPDIAKLLWPKSVAIVGASSDTRGLRGRIVQIMRSHPYAGAVYPVSRSETEVQGLKAYRSVTELPPTDLAAMIIPAKFVPQELENCGKAGIKAAIILSSGFAEERGETGPELQRQVQAIAQKYDMAVSGPNGEGFANTAASLCPTFSPAMDPGDVPL